MNKRYQYMYGAAAPNLEPEQQGTQDGKKVRKNKVQVIKNAAVIPKSGLIFMVVAVFVLCFILIYRYALITELNYNLDKSADSFNQMKDINSKLKVEIDSSTDLTRIQTIAEERLDMHKPDKYQIVCVDVPRTSFTKVSAGYVNEEETWSDKMQDNIAGLAKMIIR